MSSAGPRAGARDLDDADLVVLSHLRWDWVWQRPQHVISRMAQRRRTLFVEEPVVADVEAPSVQTQQQGVLTRLWVETPHGTGGNEYAQRPASEYAEGIERWLAGRERDVWLYTPTALPIADILHPRLLIYDVMDDLSSFADATPEMKMQTHRALAAADVAFAGGRSLHRTAAAARGGRATHLFPSGVECSHYEGSRTLRQSKDRPVAG